MGIGVLGPFEVVVGGTPLAVGGPQPRAVLALLALRANEVVGTATLVDALWGDRPPETAVRVVRTYVSRLRRVLDGVPELGARVVSASPGYRLAIDPDRVDARLFERLVASARAHAGAGRLDGAAAELRRALDLWRGDVLADMPGLRPARAAASHLEQLRLAALEERVEADLALGRHTEIVPELIALTEAHPYRERLWGQLMVALYRAGRQAEALSAYRRLRDTLVDQFGIEPGPELQALEHRVLLQEVEAAAGAGPPAGGGPGDRAPAGPDRPAVPLPPAVAHPVHDRPLAGRAREQALLATALDEARAGHFGAVLLGGPPGIGKTALASRFARRAHADGATVLLGRADEGSAVPFLALREAVGHWARHQGTPAGATAAGRLAADDAALLARFAPELTPPDAPPRADDGPGGDADRQRLFEAVGRWVEAVADPVSGPPAVLVLDDLQWADPATLLVVRHMLRHPPAAGALLLATHRDVDLDEDHLLLDLLAGTHSDGHVRRVALGGLDEADLLDLLAGVASGAGTGTGTDDVDPTFAAELARATGGNPLFVHETVRFLTEQGTIAPGAGRWAAGSGLTAHGVPAGVKEVIGQRLRRLPGATAEALRGASVLGERCDVQLLAKVMGIPHAAVVEAAEPATAAGLLAGGRDPALLVFTHALVREAVLDGVPLPDRARAHWRAGTALQARAAGRVDAVLGEIADHLTAGVAAGTAAPAVEANVRAGQKALGALAFESAAARFEAALALVDGAAPGDGLADLAYEAAFGLGQAGGALSDRTRQRTGFLRAAAVSRAQARPEQLAHAAMGFVDYVNAGTVVVGADEWHREQALAQDLLDEALARMGGAVNPAHLLLLTHQAGRAVTLARPEEAEAFADAAVGLAHRLDDPTAVPFALVARVWARLGDPRLPDLRGVSREALAFSAPPEHRVSLRIFVVPTLPIAALQLGDRPDFDAIRHRVANDPDTLGSTHLQAYLQMWDAAVALADGRIDEAEHLTVTMPGADDWNVWGDVVGLLTIAVGLERGDAGVRSSLDDYLAGTPDAVGARILAIADATAAGDRDRCRRHLAALDDVLPLDRLAWHAPLVLRHLGDATARLDDTDLAARLLHRARPFSGQLLVTYAATTVEGAADRVVGQCLSVLGHHDEAVAHLRAGRALEQRFGAEALAAHSGYWLARALLRRDGGGGDDREAARRLLDEVAGVTGRTGMRALAAHVAGLAAHQL